MKSVLFLLLSPLTLFAQWSELNSPGINVPASQFATERVSALTFNSGSELFYGTGYFPTSISGVCWQDCYAFDLNTNMWSVKNAVPFSKRYGEYGTFLNGKGYSLMGNTSVVTNSALNDCWEYDTSMDAWTQKANFPGIASIASLGFRSDSAIYILSSNDTNFTTTTSSLYRFQPSVNSWILMNTPPLIGRLGAVTFSFSTEAFITGGKDSLGQDLNDVWEYSFLSDSWIQKANISFNLFSTTPQTATSSGLGFSIQVSDDTLRIYNPVNDTWSSKYYGIYSTAIYPDTNGIFLIDQSSVRVDKYDLTSDSFITLCSKPVNINGSGIQLNNKVYIENRIYDPATQIWSVDSQLPFSLNWAINDTGYNLTGTTITGYDPISHSIFYPAVQTSGMIAFTGFVINGKGYAGVQNGNVMELWEYDPAFLQWARKSDFPRTARSGSTGFSVGSKGYLVSGLDPDSSYCIRDVWEYDPFLDTWTEKNMPPFTGRHDGYGFGGTNTGYICNGLGDTGGYLQEIWQYNQLTDTWNSIGSPGYYFYFSFCEVRDP